MNKNIVCKNNRNNFFEFITDSIVVTDSKFIIETINQAILELLGYREEEIIGRPLELLFDKEVGESLCNNISGQLSDQSYIKNYETDLRTKTGEKIPVVLSASILEFMEENSGGYIFAVKESRENKTWENIFNIINDSITIHDKDFNIILANKAAEEILGCSASEIHKQKCFNSYHGTACPPEKCPSCQTLITGHPSTNEIFEPHLKKFLEIKALPQLDSNNQVTGLIHIVRDISKRKKAEEQLKIAKETAEAANRAKSEFLANMSHEIRTPMNGVIGMADLLLDTELTNNQKEYLDMLKMSAENLLFIINDILDFSKIEAGKLDLEHVEFNLRSTLADTLKTLAVSAYAKGLELLYNVSHDVPNIILGDPGKLCQILINLVGNAIKFTKNGKVVVSIDIESRTEDEVFLHFAVSDTGIGIPEDKKEHIFNTFTQADTSTTRQYGGTGLGLSICSRLVEMMQGKIWVESEIGKGSTFHFTADFGIIPESVKQELPEEIVK